MSAQPPSAMKVVCDNFILIIVSLFKIIQEKGTHIVHFTFRHTHPKNWFLPWAGLEPTPLWLLVGHAKPLHNQGYQRWQRSSLMRWLSSVGIPRAQLSFTWVCILASNHLEIMFATKCIPNFYKDSICIRNKWFSDLISRAPPSMTC